MRPELLDLPQPNWFNHGEQILGLLDQHKPLDCVELGSNRGCSAIATARVIRKWNGRLTCVDTWEGWPGGVSREEFVKNIVEANVCQWVLVEQMTTKRAAEIFDRLDRQFDYIYIDADHTKEGCFADLRSWWPHLKVGGLIVGDDYDDVTGIPSQGVTAAWDEFEQEVGQSFNRTYSSDKAIGRLIWGVKR